MAEINETVVLSFEVDQGKAEQQLKKVEGLILDNKKAQQELTKALKQGTITQDEYIDENIRLQQNLKKEQEQKKTLTKLLNTESNSRNAVKNRVSQLVKEYDNLNLATEKGIKRADQLEKELAQLNAQLTKGDKAAGLFKNQIGNYPQQLGDAAKNMNIMGTSVGSLTSQMAGFLNPAGAALGIVSGLVTAYASSTRGAKDLEFAQNQLSAAFNLANNELAKFISASDEDGEGLFSSLTSSFISSFAGAQIDAISKIAAKNIELLEDLERKELEVRANISDRVEQNQEQLEFIADEQNKINDRLGATDVIEKNLLTNKKEILAVLNEQLAALEFQLGLSDNDENIQTLIVQKKREIAKESATAEKQLTRNNKLQDDLNAKIAKQLKLTQELFAFDVREANKPNISLAQPGQGVDTVSNTATASADLTDSIIADSEKRQEQFVNELKTVDFTEKQKRDQYIETNALRKKLDQEDLERERATADGFLAIGSSLAHGLSALAKEGSEEQKALAITGIAIDTAAAIAGAVASAQDIPYPGNLAAMASAIAAVLAAIAEAKAIGGFAEGGWTGPGNKHDVAGYVHADEYVVPKNVNNSPAAQPHLAALERMRTGYADGGYVANLNTQSANNSLLIANAFKNLPPIEASWVEGRAIGRKLEFKERKARI